MYVLPSIIFSGTVLLVVVAGMATEVSAALMCRSVLHHPS
jgi:hypothetical protein